MTVVAEATNLSIILAARGDPMAVCEQVPWLARFACIPQDASAPLAMSGPHPRAVGSYGPECIAWAHRELGLRMRWWQALAIYRQLEHDPAGALVWREINESGPRRIGKSVRLRVVALWRVAHADLIGETQLAMLVSKDLAVGKEIHRGSWRWAESKGWKVTRLNGGQEVEAPGENRWLLRADTAVYGYDVGYGQVDESWNADPAAITDGLEPALLERLWAQLHLTSTAHVKATSLMRRRLTAALRDADPDVLLLLWGAHPDANLSLESTWRSASPHWTMARLELIRRKHNAALAGENEPEFDDPDPVRGWASQYLNVWPLLLSSHGESLVMPSWPRCVTSNAAPPPTALGVSIDLDRVWVSVGMSSSGDLPHLAPVSVMRTGSPVVLRCRLDQDRAFVVSEVARIQRDTGCVVAMDRKGGKDSVDSFEKELTDAGVIVKPFGLDDYVNACSDIFDAIGAKEAEHGDYPDLNEAVAAAGWRKVGPKRRVWAAVNGDISMLEATTLAYGARDMATSVYDSRDMVVL